MLVLTARCRRLLAGSKPMIMARQQAGSNRTGAGEGQQQQNRELNARHGRCLVTASGSAGDLGAAAAYDVRGRLRR